jgi:uncharacterized protein YqgV (UPF0045/DUF77 family)
VLRLEFIVEPFVDGRPGPHVTAAVTAVEAQGFTVEFGPFGSSVDVPASEIGAVARALLDAAYGNGATHVSMHVQSEADA